MLAQDAMRTPTKKTPPRNENLINMDTPKRPVQDSPGFTQFASGRAKVSKKLALATIPPPPANFPPPASSQEPEKSTAILQPVAETEETTRKVTTTTAIIEAKQENIAEQESR